MTCDPRLLRPFVVLAEERHFGRAARRLNVTQPALSQQIARLETQLGAPLLDRSRGRVELSDAGLAVLDSARTAVRAADTAAAIGREFAAGQRGELRLGLSPGVHYLAQRLLADLARRRPRLRIRSRQDNTGLLTRLVSAGELEVVLGFCAEPCARVVGEPLREERAVLAVAAGHPLERRSTVALGELRDETFALVDAADGAGYNEAVRRRCRASGFEARTATDPHGPMAWETAVRMRGCVGLTTRSAAPSTALGVRLIRIEPPVTFPVQLLHGETIGPAGRAFVELARAHAPQIVLDLPNRA